MKMLVLSAGLVLEFAMVALHQSEVDEVPAAHEPAEPAKHSAGRPAAGAEPLSRKFPP
jgi:hypothetical protein